MPPLLPRRPCAGGAFGSAWNNLTTVDAGYDVIAGTGNQNQYDNFVFLPSGPQSLSFDFAAPPGYGDSYSAGGRILYSATPFRWGWDGTVATGFDVNSLDPTRAFTLDLADFQGGSLYLALNFTYGSDLAYNIGVPGNACHGTPAPIPLPAGALFIGTGIAALAALGARRRKTAARLTRDAKRACRKTRPSGRRKRQTGMRFPGRSRPGKASGARFRVADQHRPHPRVASQPLRIPESERLLRGKPLAGGLVQHLRQAGAAHRVHAARDQPFVDPRIRRQDDNGPILHAVSSHWTSCRASP